MRLLERPIYYGWYVLAAVSGVDFANNATAIGVLTVFIIPLSEEFGWTRTQISVATGVGAVLGALTAPFAGRLTDRLGARIPLSLGSFLIVLAMLNLAAMQSLTWFYFSFGLARLADQGFVQPTSPPAIARWFRRYRGRAMAVLFFAKSAGGVGLPLVVQLLITLWHWRIAWLMLGGMMLVMGLLPCALLVRRQPEDLGLSIDGDPQPLQPAHTPPNGAIEAAEAPSEADDSWPLGEALKTSGLWLLLAAGFVAGVAGTGVALHLMPHLLHQGITSSAAVGAVSISFLASALGTFGWGYGADRLAVQYLMAITYALRAASIAILLVTDTLFEAYIFAILQGLAEGGLGTLTPLMVADYYGRLHLGAIYGVIRALQVSGFALGPVISGATFDLTQSYHGAFTAFLALSIVGTTLVALARPPKR
jgi:MFS transporter, OFA family, oxalate/formate antiporter